MNVDLGVTALAGLLGVGVVIQGDPVLYWSAALTTVVAVASGCLVERVDAHVVMRRPFRRRRYLAAAECRFGYQAVNRLLKLYLTDGRTRIDVTSYLPLGVRRIEAATARLNATLLDEPAPVRSRAAARLAAADRSAMDAAPAAVTAYHRRPVHHWVILALVVVVAVYSVVGYFLFE